MQQNNVIIICGPTAVGKTAFAVHLAQQLQTDIISADSRQCFKELNIGVAKPSVEELQAAKHYFINSHSIQDEMNAGIFEQYALAAAAEIFQQHFTAVMVGGTGLYIKAFTDGMDAIPTVDPVIRQQVTEDYRLYGLEYLQEKVAENDPLLWQVAEQQNPQRLMRALEVILSTGKSITTFRKGNKETRPFNILKIGLELPREQLYRQINKRVDIMMQQGLADEVKNLQNYRNCNALQTVGYKELFDYFDGKASLKEAVANIKTNTRHYAKRQLTWFKKDETIHWFNPFDADALSFIRTKTTNNNRR